LSQKIVKWPLDYFNILLQLFLQDRSLISLISTTALDKLLVTMPAAHPSKNHLISKAGRLSFSQQLKTICHFLILAQNFKKISSVTVFTEVVAMISSFHRLSEKKNERKIMRTNYKCSRNINRIKSPKAP